MNRIRAAGFEVYFGVSDYRSIEGRLVVWVYNNCSEDDDDDYDDESIRFTSTFYRRGILSSHFVTLHFHTSSTFTRSFRI